jgi:shikimate dehydrogenase
MEIYGLIGKKLTHSFSPAYFNRKFSELKLDAEYRLFELEAISGLPELIKNTAELSGLNVTIPYKKEVIPFLDEMDDVAIELGAVNTIKICNEKGSKMLKGFNTDVVGFEKSLKPLISGRKNIRALVLGTGGSAQAVSWVLAKLGIQHNFVSRFDSSTAFVYTKLNHQVISDHNLIINTTPLGMYPNVKSAPPILYSSINSNHILYDLVYNPSLTVFLEKGKEMGATVLNGQLMLELQAEAAWEIFKKPS